MKLFSITFPRAKPKGTLDDKGVYLTVYPLSCPYTDTVCSILMGPSGFKTSLRKFRMTF